MADPLSTSSSSYLPRAIVPSDRPVGRGWIQRALLAAGKEAGREGRLDPERLKVLVKGAALWKKRETPLLQDLFQKAIGLITAPRKALATLIDQLTLFLLDLEDAAQTPESLKERLQTLKTTPLWPALERGLKEASPGVVLEDNPRALLQVVTASGERLIEALIRTLDNEKKAAFTSWNLAALLDNVAKGAKQRDAEPLLANRPEAEDALYKTLAEQFIETVGVPKTATDYEALRAIDDERLRVEIAKIAVRSQMMDLRQVAKNFGITDPANFTAVVKEAAINYGTRVAQQIKDLGITDQKVMKEIALVAMKSGGSKYIANFAFVDQETLIELAKAAAESDVSGHIEEFGITDHRALIEIAMLAAERDGGFSLCVKNYAITDQEVLFKLAQIAAARADESSFCFSHYIDRFGLVSEEARIAVAKIAAFHNPESLTEFIAHYGIKNEKALEEIAEIAARQNGEKTWANIKNFSFKDKEILKKIELLCVLDDLKKSIVRPYGHVSPSEGGPLIEASFRDLDKKIIEAIDPIKHRALERQKEQRLVLLAYALFLLKDQTVTPSVQEVIKRIIEYRNLPLALFLLEEYCQNVVPKESKRFAALVTQVHLTLPMIFLASWGADKKDPQVELFHKFLIKGRESFRNVASHSLQTVLQTLQALHQNKTLSSKEKIALLADCCAAIPTTEAEILNRMSLIQSLCTLNKAPKGPFVGDMTKALAEQVIEALQTTGMLNLKSVENFAQKYIETFGATRLPGALFTYLSRLKTLKDPLLLPAVQRFVVSVLEGTYPSVRYQTEDNAHLQRIATEAPSLWAKWQENSEASLGKDFKLVDTDNWQDLLLSGSEVSESCQRIDGDPAINKGLLAYLLDGKNRMIAVKDASGKVVARAIWRLLWDPLHKRPVLFQEGIYTSRPNPTFEAAIDQYTQERARALDCLLFRQGLSEKSLSLISLGSSAPYEYVDAAGGIKEKGRYTITQAAEVK